MAELLTVKQVAELLQLHEMTIRRYIKAGKLPAVRIGRNVRIPRQAVEALLAPSNEAESLLHESGVSYTTDTSSLLQEAILHLSERDPRILQMLAKEIVEAAHRQTQKDERPIEEVRRDLEVLLTEIQAEAIAKGTAIEA